MRPLGKVPVAALLLTAALALASGRGGWAATAATSSAPVGQVTLHEMTVEVAPTITPRLFTVACAAGEEIVSGGYAHLSAAVRVAFSYPSRAGRLPVPAQSSATTLPVPAQSSPTTLPVPAQSSVTRLPVPSGGLADAWTVGVLNDARTVQTLQVVAACLAGSGGRSSVRVATQTHAESRFSLAVDCPDRSVRTGGGYSSQWDLTFGTAVVDGSYPIQDNGWGLDVVVRPGDPDVSDRATVSVYAVCLAPAVEVADASPVVFDLASGTQQCTDGDSPLGPTCTVPRSGARTVNCAGDQVLVGGGYQVTSANSAGDYAVVIDAPTAGPAWNITVSGSTPTSEPISIRVTPLCLIPAVATVSSSTGVTPQDSESSAPQAGPWDPAAAIGVGSAVLLLLLLLLAALALRRAAKRRSPREGGGRGQDDRWPDARVGVVVRAQRAAYRFNELRELP